MIFTSHAKTRMEEYGIKEDGVEETVREPEKLFLDIKTGGLIAIRKYGEKHLVVVYESNEEIVIVTVFSTSKINKIVENRVRNGRLGL
ncbi:hypothetical protein DRP04_03075 [Archaeoglobales archaeon]|nr:MAG: hypothetical protein DRP04_03075 [Archaeoglobales archaeon]